MKTLLCKLLGYSITLFLLAALLLAWFQYRKHL